MLLTAPSGRQRALARRRAVEHLLGGELHQRGLELVDEVDAVGNGRQREGDDRPRALTLVAHGPHRAAGAPIDLAGDGRRGQGRRHVGGRFFRTLHGSQRAARLVRSAIQREGRVRVLRLGVQRAQRRRPEVIVRRQARLAGRVPLAEVGFELGEAFCGRVRCCHWRLRRNGARHDQQDNKCRRQNMTGHFAFNVTKVAVL